MIEREDGIIIRQPDETDFQSVFDLRWRVLDRPVGGEQQIELSSGDQKRDVIHVAAFDKNVAISTVRVDPYLGRGEDVYLVSKMATDPIYQRRGIGRDVLGEAERLAAMRGAKHMVLHSRLGAVSFYESLRYLANGRIEIHDGDENPEMEKDL